MKLLMLASTLFVALVVLFSDCVDGKECTNTPTDLSSHTFRYELLNSDNMTWKEEVLSHNHLTPTDDLAWASLLPRKTLNRKDGFGWMMMYKQMKNHVSENFLKEVPTVDVRLDPDSIHGQAQQTNLEYLLMLEVDSLVWSFRKTANLPTLGTPYGGWESPDQELRGHFVGYITNQQTKQKGGEQEHENFIRLTLTVGLFTDPKFLILNSIPKTHLSPSFSLSLTAI
ncbi:hypothetical protein L1887_18890 [Cichorium endivia]|nr:hypothetical protein L1887_18890 [Cichorium endivia]